MSDKVRTALTTEFTARPSSVQRRKVSLSPLGNSPIGHALFLQRAVGNHAVEKLLALGGAPALQRRPQAPDPAAERAAAVREAQVSVACSTEQLEAQSNAEDALKLQGRKRTDTSYALTLGRQDSARMQKSRALSAELQQEITVKIRFFRGAPRGTTWSTTTSMSCWCNMPTANLNISC